MVSPTFLWRAHSRELASAMAGISWEPLSPTLSPSDGERETESGRREGEGGGWGVGDRGEGEGEDDDGGWEMEDRAFSKFQKSASLPRRLLGLLKVKWPVSVSGFTPRRRGFCARSRFRQLASSPSRTRNGTMRQPSRIWGSRPKAWRPSEVFRSWMTGRVDWPSRGKP